jgi:hypothetical protein
MIKQEEVDMEEQRARWLLFPRCSFIQAGELPGPPIASS